MLDGKQRSIQNYIWKMSRDVTVYVWILNVITVYTLHGMERFSGPYPHFWNNDVLDIMLLKMSYFKKCSNVSNFTRSQFANDLLDYIIHEFLSSSKQFHYNFTAWIDLWAIKKLLQKKISQMMYWNVQKIPNKKISQFCTNPIKIQEIPGIMYVRGKR